MIKQNRKAFTLLELGISLIVIGIIIAAVMSGGDVIKSADSKQFYQNFARKWSVIIDGYYDRMGYELKDTNKDGFFDGAEPTITDITSAGINLSKNISTNQVILSRYMIDGEFSGYKIVTIYLGAYDLNNTKYNFLILKNIPKDIAVAIDRYVDGSSNGAKGGAISIQTAIDDSSLPTNLSTITPLSYSSITTTVTNLGIMVEH